MNGSKPNRNPFYKSFYFWGLALILLSFTNKDVANGTSIFMTGLTVCLIGFIRDRLRNRRIKKSIKNASTVSVDNGNVLPVSENGTITKSGSEASLFDGYVIYTYIPSVYLDCDLAYSYKDVWFTCPDECVAFAKTVPKNMRLSVRISKVNSGGEKSVEILYIGETIGYMIDNKLKKMLIDYADDPNKSFLVIGEEWVDHPSVSLYFYKEKPSYKRNDYDDDDDFDDDNDDDDYIE